MLLLSRLTNKRAITLKATEKIINDIPTWHKKNIKRLILKKKQQILIEISKELKSWWQLDFASKFINHGEIGDWLLNQVGASIDAIDEPDDKSSIFDIDRTRPAVDATSFEELIRALIAKEIWVNFFGHDTKRFAFCPICEGLYCKSPSTKTYCSSACRKARCKRKKTAAKIEGLTI